MFSMEQEIDRPRLIKNGARWEVSFPIAEGISQRVDVTDDMCSWLYRERERIACVILKTNPMDVSIRDPIHGDQWIDDALRGLMEIV